VQREKQVADERARLEKIAGDARVEAALLAQRERTRLEKLEADARAELQAAQVLAAQAKVAEARRALAEVELKTVELELKKQQLAHALELDRAARLKEIENTVSHEAIQLTVAKELPKLAAAFQQQMGEVHVTAVDGANPFGYVAAAVEGVMGLARSAGLELPKKSET
jgi:hypothetical protein